MESINSAKKNERLPYLDNCKIFLILLVISYHSAHAYSNSSWVFKDDSNIKWVMNYLTINRSFFMGLFFFISAYLATKSILKYNKKEFLIRKARRLLLPVFFLCFLAVPIYFYIAYISKYNSISFGRFYIYEYILKGHVTYQHGWFLVILFFFLEAYMLIYNLLIKKFNTKPIKLNLNLFTFLIFAMIIGAFSFIIRKYYSVNEWVTLLGIIGFEPAHIVQYIIMFILGIIANNNNWLNKLNKKIGVISLSIGLILIILFCTKNYIGTSIKDFINNYWAFIESIICVYLSIGIIYIFKRFFNKETKISKAIFNSYFGAFLIHNDFVVIFQVLFAKTNINVNGKYAIVAISSIIVSFLISFIFVYCYRKVRYRYFNNIVVY